MGDSDSDSEDMEEEPSQPLDCQPKVFLQCFYEEINNARLLDLDPEGATAMLALCWIELIILIFLPSNELSIVRCS